MSEDYLKSKVESILPILSTLCSTFGMILVFINLLTCGIIGLPLFIKV